MPWQWLSEMNQVKWIKVSLPFTSHIKQILLKIRKVKLGEEQKQKQLEFDSKAPSHSMKSLGFHEKSKWIKVIIKKVTWT